ncbi:MAG: N-acetyltransferase [Chloroflexi bacterium]|nr:MAG: N-acetyltransferase [Chloroflexota bacterium]
MNTHKTHQTNFQIQLRDVTSDDLPIFFQHQQEPEAVWMAAFTAKDPSDKEAFMAHWHRLLQNETIIKKTILVNGRVAGHLARFERDGDPEITYWLGQAWWGKGIMTKALTQYLNMEEKRPLYARVAKDNIPSLRVLQKCGFQIIGEDKGFANARNAEIEEYILRLDT